MKKLPTALTVPSNSFQVWLTMAPPLDASAPALGTAFDATAQQTIDVTAQFGTSSASNSVTLHQYHLESA